LGDIHRGACAMIRNKCAKSLAPSPPFSPPMR
jgi:hypothetical protein